MTGEEQGDGKLFVDSKGLLSDDALSSASDIDEFEGDDDERAGETSDTKGLPWRCVILSLLEEGLGRRATFRHVWLKLSDFGVTGAEAGLSNRKT